MAVRTTSAERSRTGETIVAIPPDALRYGSLRVEVSRDHLPGDLDRDFLTLVLERFVDGQWQPMVSAQATGRARPEPTVVSIQHTNAAGYALPLTGDVRARVITKRPARFAIAVEKSDDPGDPPPLEPTHRSVAHDGEANLSAGIHFVTSVTLTGKTTAGSERLGVLHVGCEWDTTDATSVSATWGSAMTEIGTGAANAFADPVRGHAKLYHFLAPPTGATNVIFQANAGELGRGAALASSYAGVDQTTPVRTNSADPATGTGTAATVTCDPSATGDMVVDALWALAPSAAPTPHVSQTAIAASVESSGGSDYWGGASREAGAATVVMSWTQAADEWALFAASLQASSGGGSSVTPPVGAQTLAGAAGRLDHGLAVPIGRR
jgi:hypothetical protein